MATKAEKAAAEEARQDQRDTALMQFAGAVGSLATQLEGFGTKLEQLATKPEIEEKVEESRVAGQRRLFGAVALAVFLSFLLGVGQFLVTYYGVVRPTQDSLEILESQTGEEAQERLNDLITRLLDTQDCRNRLALEEAFNAALAAQGETNRVDMTLPDYCARVGVSDVEVVPGEVPNDQGGGGANGQSAVTPGTGSTVESQGGGTQSGPAGPPGPPGPAGQPGAPGDGGGGGDTPPTTDPPNESPVCTIPIIGQVAC